MWFSFWRSRNRFSLDELRYLTDQLMKIEIVNAVNKDFVIEALRSIAELITYGDQHDASFFEFFMEKQVMGEFVRVLKISKTIIVSLQLLQTMSIMIQNLKNEHSIYYMFSNEHINYLITYSFDFRNEELLSYYISFLRAISGKLNESTISLLVKTQNHEVIDFPLYVEAIRFAFHEEGMIRTAVRALTLNVYHVGDECVNKFVSGSPHSEYFFNLVSFFKDQCISLNGLVLNASKNPCPESTSTVISFVDEIEDNLYYFSDVISAGIPDVGRLITDNMLKLLICPLLLPSLIMDIVDVQELKMGAITSLYLLCCILRIVKIKDLANTIAAALFCPVKALLPASECKVNGYKSESVSAHRSSNADDSNCNMELDSRRLRVSIPCLSSSSVCQSSDALQNCTGTHFSVRDALLSYLIKGNDDQVLGSLSVLATLLQTKELDESMLDALGILPQRKQHKKLLLKALVGEESGEEQLFSSKSYLVDGIGSELDNFLQKLKDHYEVSFSSLEVGASPQLHRFQVLDALVSLLCRSNISAEALWDGGWLLRQLLPYSKAEFSSHHLELLKDSYNSCGSNLLDEVNGYWSDLLITVLSDEWRKCKRAIEASSPCRESKCILLPLQKSVSEELNSTDSSFTTGKRMCEIVKVFVLLLQIQIFSVGRALPDQPPIDPPVEVPENSRSKASGLVSNLRPGTELNLVDAVPCRIAFERGKERQFSLLAISIGTSGWVVLAEELPLRRHYGVARVIAPLTGCNPRIDDKHARWLHLRIRPSSLPFMDSSRTPVGGKGKMRALVDGRWILAFQDEESCKSALSMILGEIRSQRNAVERRVRPMLDIQKIVNSMNTCASAEAATSRTTSNSL